MAATWAEDLTGAAFTGDHERVQELLALPNGSVDQKNQRGQTALYCAARKGHKNIVKALLAHHADVGALENSGSTPLHAAAYEKHVEVYQLLLDHGARTDITNNYGELPHLEGVAPAVAAPPAPAPPAPAPASPAPAPAPVPTASAEFGGQGGPPQISLHDAAYNGDIETLKAGLAEDPASLPTRINAPNQRGQSPLHCAARQGHDSCLQLLLMKKADPNCRLVGRRADGREDGSTPLHGASWGLHENACQLLLQSGASAAIGQLDSGQTPRFELLFYAADSPARTEILHMLANAEKEQFVALAAKGDNRALQTLLDSEQALGEASSLGLAEAMSEGRTALIAATSQNRLDTVKFLLDRSTTNINAFGAADGMTALHVAATCGLPAMTKELLARGADSTLPTLEKKSLLEIADPSVFSTLRDHNLAKGFITACPQGARCLRLREREHYLETAHETLYPCNDALCSSYPPTHDHFKVFSHRCANGPGCSQLSDPEHVRNHFHEPANPTRGNKQLVEDMMALALKDQDATMEVTEQHSGPGQEWVPGAPAGAPAVGAAGGDAESVDTKDGELTDIDIPNHVIDKQVGKGRFGTVYLAQETTLKRPEAIKLLHRKMAKQPGALDSFLLEAQNTAKVSSPNVITIFSVIKLDLERVAIIMEYVEGKTLKEILAEKQRLEVREALYYVEKCLCGLMDAHEVLLHRDIKPDNVMVRCKPDGNHVVKLVDFGLAVVPTGSTLNIAGTPAYMAPEQWLKVQLTPAADLWSVGVMLFHLLTGKLPFSGHIQLASVRDPTQPSPSLPGDFPPCVKQIVAKALEKDPARRYQTATEMRDDIYKVQNLIRPA